MSWAKRQIEDDIGWGLPKTNDKPINFKEYEKIYNRFWSDKKKVEKSDIGFMVKLINERMVEDGKRTNR